MNRLIKGLILSGLVSGSAFAGSFNLDKEHVPNELIVKFKGGVKSVAATKALNALRARTKYVFKSNGAAVIRLPNSANKNSLLDKARQLAARPDVMYVEANTILRASSTLPNDPSFSKQYGMHNTGANRISVRGTADADIDAPEAWELSTGSKNVLVAVIDTGIDYKHPDIAPNYWTNPGESGTDANGKDKSTNGVDDDNNGYVDDFRGWDFANNDNDPIDDHDHGTHCAGVIGARGNDGVGVAGVNWEVSMVGLKFLTGSGSGSLENAVKAIEYATTIGATLSSNSWGGGGFSQTMMDAIKKANDKNVLFVAAAGNDGRNNDQSPSYPASYAVDNVISVAASDSADARANFSNYGKVSVHVAAPGKDIFSTTKGNTYKSFSGTSMATPHVAGVAALVKAAFPSATASQIKSRIVNGVDTIAAWEPLVQSGGRLNAFNALEDDEVAPEKVSGLTVVDTTTSSVTLRWSPSGDDGSAGAAKAYQVRVSNKAIVSEADWEAATPVQSAVQISDNEVRATLSFQGFNINGYASVRALDNVGNRSGLATSRQFATKPVRKIFEKTATNLDGLTAEAPWAIESVDGAKVFSDSPGGSYKENANVSLTTDSITLTSDDATLVLDVKYDVESSFDFFWIEVSTDNGATWKAVQKLTGSNGAEFAQKVIPLREHIQGASSIRVRFRVQADHTINKDGVKIRGFDVVAPQKRR